MRPPEQKTSSIDLGTIIIAGVIAVGIVLAISYFAVRAYEAEQQVKSLQQENAEAQEMSPIVEAETPTQPPIEPTKVIPLVTPPIPEPEPEKAKFTLEQYVNFPPEIQAFIWCSWIDNTLPQFTDDPALRRKLVLACVDRADAATRLMPERGRASLDFMALEGVVDSSIAESLPEILLKGKPDPVPVLRGFDFTTKYVDANPVDRVLWWEEFIASGHPEIESVEKRQRIMTALILSNMKLAEIKRRVPIFEFFRTIDQEFDKVILDDNQQLESEELLDPI